MANWTPIRETRTRYKYFLETPVMAKDLMTAFSAASEEFEDVFGRKPTYDDDIRLSSDDESEVYWYFDRGK